MFLRALAVDPRPILATGLGPRGAGCFREKTKQKTVKQLCLHVFHGNHTMFIVIAVPFRMGTSHKSGLVPSCRDDQHAVTLRSPRFLVIGMLLFMFVNICASPFSLGGGVIYFRFLKTDQCLKVVIKG